jgi:hypothetical protein
MHCALPFLTACAACIACAGSTVNEKPGPRGLRADQHLDIAQREAENADQLTRWPDTRSSNSGAQPDQLISAWFGMWDTTAEHQQIAQRHRTAAAQLEAEYEQACGATPAAVASVSPVQRYGVGTSPIPGGTVVLLTPDAGSPDALLAAMRCHRAWMMLGRTDMDDCPLDLPGLRVSARGDAEGIELTMTVDAPALVPELRRRAAHDLEAAQHHPHAMK